MLAEEYREAKQWRDWQKRRYEHRELSRIGALRPQVTSRILLNKWQRQKEKNTSNGWKKKNIGTNVKKKDMKKNKPNHIPFFRYYWNEDLKLPTRNNCLECNDQYWEYRQSQTNRQFVHERLNNIITSIGA